MLPPAQAISNSGTSYPDSRKQQEAVIDVTPRQAASTPHAVQVLEQNAAIAGRLNMLLLSGQERMSQNLASLIDLLGRALKVERNDGESLSGYAARLVQTLTNLPQEERQSVQRQLTQLFGGLQLRTLMEAFRNPVGPEAAMLSIYLELYRNKDRDLAARSAVTSYRQNAGEQKPVAGIASPSNRTLSQTQKPSASATTSQPAEWWDEALEGDIVRPVTRDAGARSAPDFGSGDEILRTGARSAGSAENPVLSRNAAAGSPEARVENPDSGVDDIRTLQERLRQNFEFGDEPEPSPGFSRTVTVPTPEVRTAAHATRMMLSNGNAIQAGADIQTPIAEPETTAAPEGLQETIEDAADQALNTLKSWKDAVVRALAGPADLLPQAAETDGEASAPTAAYASSTEMPEEQPPIDKARLSGMTKSEAMQPAASAFEGEAPGDPTTADIRHRAWAEGEVSPRATADIDQPALRQSMVLREGVPLPMVSYLMAQDEYVEDEKELRRRYEDEDGGDDFAGGDDGGGKDQAGEEQANAAEEAPAEQHPLAAEGEVDGRTPLLTADLSDGLPAADLYQRMADWA
ncbi:hypothetical protein J5N58_19815 [Rhizobium cremeum]|uniref:hypothetical protein n=1 Tax=Rhizobium cremeum TaxID=2813827 RepID=UPI000DDEC405|nr:hypothetical protein [Rhizobium cremeum]MCJ7997189.1 hypothetical protein [Rhizobium cremeum]MCJ8001933.1 hypothetical protein [Rhizobium cremeum]